MLPQIVSRWLSTVYMVLARMGAVFSNPRDGWAWAGSDPMQAIGLDKFVEVRTLLIHPLCSQYATDGKDNAMQAVGPGMVFVDAFAALRLIDALLILDCS